MYKTTILYQDGDYTSEKILETDNELKVIAEDGFIYLNEHKTSEDDNGLKELRITTVYAINKNALISMELNKKAKKIESEHTIRYADGEEVTTCY